MNNSLIIGTNLITNFVNDTDNLIDRLLSLDYDKSMKSRWTTSFGRSYDYSGITYPDTNIPDFIANMITPIANVIGFTPNNCLNVYNDGDSSMGYHSDNVDILSPGTGVAIISIGYPRILRFRNISDRSCFVNYVMKSGSLFYMTDTIQSEWMHSIPKMNTSNATHPLFSMRISLTFRNII